MPGQSREPAESDSPPRALPGGPDATRGPVEGAVRYAGAQMGLDQGKHPVFASALLLAAALDDRWTPVEKIPGLATELRQHLKVLELDQVSAGVKKDDVVKKIGTGFRKPQRSA